MEAPDGTLLSFTDLKKSQWYLKKGLATLISEDPFTVRLNFEPSGRTEQEKEAAWVDDQYYCTNRENKCVVCGLNENFLRFHVVPTLYRSHFPDSLKSHRSHDVLLMCFDCHNKASRHQDYLKGQIAKKYDCPLQEVSSFYDLNVKINMIRKAAGGLLMPHKMPEKNTQELRMTIVKHLRSDLVQNHIPTDIQA